MYQERQNSSSATIFSQTSSSIASKVGILFVARRFRERSAGIRCFLALIVKTKVRDETATSMPRGSDKAGFTKLLKTSVSSFVDHRMGTRPESDSSSFGEHFAVLRDTSMSRVVLPIIVTVAQGCKSASFVASLSLQPAAALTSKLQPRPALKALGCSARARVGKSRKSRDPRFDIFQRPALTSTLIRGGSDPPKSTLMVHAIHIGCILRLYSGI